MNSNAMNTATTATTNRIIAPRLITHLRHTKNDTSNYQCTVDKSHRTKRSRNSNHEFQTTVLKGSIYSTGRCRRCKRTRGAQTNCPHRGHYEACPLWVKSRHMRGTKPCPLYPQ